MSRSEADQNPDCVDFVPTRYVEECRAFTAAEPPALAALAGFLGMESPLPEIARVFYTRGGCWNLALALRAATGFPIELAYRDGVPVHAYVVVDDEALGVDAYGERPLQAARKTFDKFRRVSPAELLEELARAGDEGLVAEVEQDDVRACAEAAATFLLAECAPELLSTYRISRRSARSARRSRATAAATYRS